MVNEGISMRDEECIVTYGLQRNYFECSHKHDRECLIIKVLLGDMKIRKIDVYKIDA